MPGGIHRQIPGGRDYACGKVRPSVEQRLLLYAVFEISDLDLIHVLALEKPLTEILQLYPISPKPRDEIPSLGLPSQIPRRIGHNQTIPILPRLLSIASDPDAGIATS